ncbi:iron-containing alcohol dehydrogenase [Tolumonas auensis DSM 9187]|uniref:Iron-containing alcohol dehydrogenase n=1 Tax=Tolumonas auensis (strain DSM 9187 / NBRC 110442 / TA 4) TaxID=595494 RepID=C4LB45_TOLAT|nr:iron-containing alcohol dehydrogenase [Tolumonas auensis]ACQ94248.1 iron-containing alcohol dehydrogenase [Tolumonas auensis DSM 9187]
MNNFSFRNPTKIHFGKGQIAKIKEEIPADARVLITYGGGSIKKNGVLDQVHAALQNITFFEFGGIEPNPHFETLMKAVELVKQEKITYLLAVGGGSVVDGTKFIAAAAEYQNDPLELLPTKGAHIRKALPLGCVLTLPATGSEMNGNAVITRWETKDKIGIFSDLIRPAFSVLDPETTYSLPDRQTGNGVVDAIVHIVEQYMTYPVNGKVQDRYAESLLQILMEDGPQALKDPTNYDVRANIMWAATQALNGTLSLGVPGDWSIHAIGHQITALYGLDHAQTLAIVLPAIWSYKKEQKKAKLLQYASRVLGITAGDDDQRATLAIEKTREFFELMGVPTRLSDYGLDETVIPAVVAKLKQHGRLKLGEHGDITPDDVAQLLKLAL